MKQVQWKSSIGALTCCGALFCASVPARAIDISRPALLVLVADKTRAQKCITIDGHELCIGKKKVGTPADGALGNGAPQGGAGGAPQGGAAGAAGAPPMDNAGQGGGNGGAAPDGNAGAPPADNAGTPPADAADTALEPGEHRCPVGFLVLETQNKFGAFCEEVKGFAIPAGMESIERACPAGYIVLAVENQYKALCEPKEGFPAAPAN